MHFRTWNFSFVCLTVISFKCCGCKTEVSLWSMSFLISTKSDFYTFIANYFRRASYSIWNSFSYCSFFSRAVILLPLWLFNKSAFWEAEADGFLFLGYGALMRWSGRTFSLLSTFFFSLNLSVSAYMLKLGCETDGLIAPLLCIGWITAMLAWVNFGSSL